MTAQANAVDVAQFLAAAREKAPAPLKDAYATFADLYERKLWHQLTLAVEAFSLQSAAAPHLKALYDNFVAQFEARMNQLKLVQFLIRVGRQLGNPKDAAELLGAHAARLEGSADHRNAFVLATMEVASYKLVVGDHAGTLASIKTCAGLVEELQGVDAVVHASYYRVAADYYKYKADFAQYYKHALLFLSAVQLDELSKADQAQWAHDLALSAILGEGVYNFGELLMHKVLDALVGTSNAWLHDLLLCYNTGNVEQFDRATQSAGFKQDKLLGANLPFIKEKLRLMTLTDIVFRRNKDERAQLLFADIAREVRVPADQVELLVIKALSLGLVRGSINQVKQTVVVTWVQPRVLDKAHIGVIRARLAEWAQKVRSHVTELEGNEHMREVFVQ